MHLKPQSSNVKESVPSVSEPLTQPLPAKAEPAFDHLCQAAAALMEVPIGFIGFQDGQRAWFSSFPGIDYETVHRQMHALAQLVQPDVPTVIPDTALDPRLRGNGAVPNLGTIRFFAGATVSSPDGRRQGTICACGLQPQSASSTQVLGLQCLASAAATLLEYRRVAHAMAQAYSHHKNFDGIISMCAWCKSVRDEDGRWEKIESFLRSKADARVTHCICPDCSRQSFSSYQ